MERSTPQGGGRQQSSQPPQAGREQLQPASIEEVVQTDVVTAERDTPVQTVVAMMAERDVGSVVVVDGDTPIGILTDRSVALALEDAPDVTERPADDLVSEALVTGTLEMTVFDALERLSDEEIRRLPIVDEEGELVGIVTLDDLLFVLGTELQKTMEIIEAQSPRV